VQLLYQVVPLVGMDVLGRRRIFQIINEVFRYIGIFDLKLEANETESDGVGAGQTLAAQLQEAQALIQQLAAQGGENKQQIEQVALQLADLAKTVIPEQQPQLR
jgi:hypothetical protein